MNYLEEAREERVEGELFEHRGGILEERWRGYLYWRISVEWILEIVVDAIRKNDKALNRYLSFNYLIKMFTTIYTLYLFALVNFGSSTY